MVEKYRVDYPPCRGAEAKADVAQAQNGVAAGQLLLYEPDASKGVFGRVCVLLFAGRKGECQDVEGKLPGLEAVFLAGLKEEVCHLEFFFRSLGHPLWAYAHCNSRQAVPCHYRGKSMKAAAISFKVD